MKNSASIFLILNIFLFTATQVLANSDTHITNIVNSSSNTNSSSNSHTSIHIETNGNVQDYNSDNPDGVHMESPDGTTTVDVNNNSGNTITVTQPPIPTVPTITITPPISPIPTIDKQKIQKQIDDAKSKIAEKKKQAQVRHDTFFAALEDALKHFFSSFH